MISLPTRTNLLTVAIPLLEIGLAGYQEERKFRAERQKLGAFPKEVDQTISVLDERLDSMERERDALIRRIQNLQTIVTTEIWDALADTACEPSRSLESQHQDRGELSMEEERKTNPDPSDPAVRAEALTPRLHG